MPDVERIADEPEPDHDSVREKIAVQESIFPRGYHKDCSRYWEKCLVPREVLAVEGKDSCQDESKTKDREDVTAEPDAVCFFRVAQQHCRKVRTDLIRDAGEHLPLVKPGKDASRHQLPEPEER